MSDSDSDKTRSARNPIQRVVDVARQGQARLNAYRQETAALGTWLRSHLFRNGSKGQQTKVGRSLRSAVTARYLRQRREAHLSRGRRSSTAVYALQRVTQAISRKKHR